ncbi:alpha/beta fold hydrolase [Psychroserpens jangbogonensis]|uniref:alpha/beta fold hydrolase n=1 Tax=Psychroserpens jangbogonensis TaxID=1484460 RepID=UPI00053DCFFF|nr:alpha/beta hydrolase [Psychroserpens jangbogonensis]
MKQVILKFQFIAVLIFCFFQGQSQSKDTIVDVGQYKLHFNIIQGTGTPILFESGSGNDGTVWKDIIQPIADITGATIITYDRAGLGKSTIKDGKTDFKDNQILDNVKALERGLKQLGYDEDLILVAHSLGGFYTTLFASRNEKKVKGVVFVDASLASYYSEEFVNKLKGVLSEEFLNKLKAEKIGLYNEIMNIESSIELLRKTNFPSSVPVIDLVASNPYNPFKNEDDKNRWIDGHQDFVKYHQNRTLMMINNANHYAFKDNPNFIIYQIIRVYATSVEATKTKSMLLRTLDFSSYNSNSKND